MPLVSENDNLSIEVLSNIKEGKNKYLLFFVKCLDLFY